MTQLPSAGPEREIFLRALRAYSEACTPPALTPGCPFAIEIAPGRRGCGDECLTLLAEHGAPGPVEEFAVGEFHVVRNRRPRPRHSPESTARPYDARMISLGTLLRRARRRSWPNAGPTLTRSLASWPTGQPGLKRGDPGRRSAGTYTPLLIFCVSAIGLQRLLSLRSR